LGEALELLETEPRQPITVREDKRLDLSSPDGIHDLQKPLALEIQPATDFLDEFDIRQAFGYDKFFQHLALIGEIRFLCCAGNPAVRNPPRWFGNGIAQADELPDLRFGIQAPVAIRSRHRDQPTFALPALQRLDRYAL